ncbi:MAG: 16S rRNA (cytosine(967)-C(5))-methyltransferase RsmB [Bilifractor sp.]|nr:16S rRNA (cytosine(967)-C(5))-methyltransferase RsmB [Lachnospiraceae bacterium]MDY2837570.1 16S rRNA (cytosine(967)-C(5))-methyltransferase RsmB [Bilifractor sp.]
MTERINIRELALETLLAIREECRQSHFVIREVLERYGWLTDQERAFYLRLTEGTLEYQIRLDYILNLFSRTKTERMKPVIREILRMGVYQLQFMDSVPDSAAVNESVRLAGRKGFSGLKGFVNGVLRNISRHPEKIVYPSMEDPVRSLSIRYSMPEYLVSIWMDAFGAETAEKICRGFLEQNEVTIRVRNVRKEDGSEEGTEEVLRNLEAEGAQLMKAPYVPDAWYMRSAGNPAELTAFQEGGFLMQDVSSQLAVRCAGIRPGDLVFDLCAAPGGKSLLAADLMAGTGKVISGDLTDRKAELIQENVERCRVKNMEIEVQDASAAVPGRFETADVVLADVPCSGYGVIGKKPDIKYNASREKEIELAALQRKILENAVSYVRPGGILLFSTCTVAKTENEENVKWLLENFPLEGVDLSDSLPEELLADERVRETSKRGFVQLLPGIHHCDGFFFAKFRKTV